MSDNDDALQDGISVALTGAAAMSRVGEVLLRQAQEQKARAAAETRQRAEEAAEQLRARAEVAQAFYTAAASPEWMQGASARDLATAIQGVHLWAEVDHDRFGQVAEAMREQVRTTLGVDLREAYEEQRGAAAIAALAATGARAPDKEQEPKQEQGRDYDDPARRQARRDDLEKAGTEPAAVKARVVSDELNGHDPADTAQNAQAGRAARHKPAARAPRKRREQQRSR